MCKNGKQNTKDNMEKIKIYEESGRILDVVLKEARKTKEGDNLLQVAEKLEGLIRKLGGEPAFPCNLSIDRQAAHYTPSMEEKETAHGVLKVDCGVHINGHITDAAITIDFTGEWGKLVEAAEEALENALSVIRAGVSVWKIGEAVEEVAKKYGYRPIANLGGHTLGIYHLHAGLFIPNIPKGTAVLKEGDIVAVEPFITAGRGYVEEGPIVEIFSLTRRRGKSRVVEMARRDIEKRYKTLPFARRWLKNISDVILRLMKREGVITGYPVLLDTGIVAQAEATIVVEKDGVKVLAGKRKRLKN